eukprot:IDg5925t1
MGSGTGSNKKPSLSENSAVKTLAAVFLKPLERVTAQGLLCEKKGPKGACKALSGPRLANSHKEACLKWARSNVLISRNSWKSSLFSDERRYSLDGPDEMACYRHDKRLHWDL